MTTSGADPRGLRCPTSGFTLLEILLAMAIAGLMAAAALPFLLDAFDAGGDVETEVRAVARAVRASALEEGEARRIGISARGLAAPDGPAFELPPGWALDVRRAGEARFRKPAKGEFWEFNSEGICEPLALRLRGPSQETIVEFDPLTALEPPAR